MTTTRYFTFTASDNSLSKNFRVVQSSYNPTYEKKGAVRTTLNGKWDISAGGIYLRHEYIVKVRDQEDETNMGTKDDLLTFFMYNQPNPVSGPSSKITMIDHYGNWHYVKIHGDTSPIPLGVSLTGYFAWYNMKLILLFLSDIPDMGPSS